MGTWYVGGIPYSSDDICHFGRKGMKWGKNIFGKEGVAGKVGSSLGSAASGLVKKVSSGYNAGKQYIEDKTGITAKKKYEFYKGLASRNGSRQHDNELERRELLRRKDKNNERLNNAERNLDRNVENADKKWNQLQTRSANDRNMADFYSRAAASARAKATTTTEPISMKQRRIEENTAREYQRQADERRQLGNQVRREQQQEFREADNQLRKAERELNSAIDERVALYEEKYLNRMRSDAIKNMKAAEAALYEKRRYENSLVGKVDKAVEKISKDKDKAVKSIKNWGSGAIDKGKEFAKSAGSAIFKTASDAGKGASKLAKSAGKTISKTASDVGKGASKLAKNAGKAASGAMSSIKKNGGKAISNGKKLISNVFSKKKRKSGID